MITEEQKESIIEASHNLIQALVEAHGSEQGMEFWHQLGTVLDPYYTGEIFKRMICGQFSAKIRIKEVATDIAGKPVCRIKMIKAIRTLDKRRFVLKEAKDMVDDLFNGYPIYIEPLPGNRMDTITELRNVGFVI